MPDDFLQGYEATDPKEADAPNRPTYQTYYPPGTMAETVKARWKNVPKAYPFGKARDGGGGGGE